MVVSTWALSLASLAEVGAAPGTAAAKACNDWMGYNDKASEGSSTLAKPSSSNQSSSNQITIN